VIQTLITASFNKEPAARMLSGGRTKLF